MYLHNQLGAIVAFAKLVRFVLGFYSDIKLELLPQTTLSRQWNNPLLTMEKKQIIKICKEKDIDYLACLQNPPITIDQAVQKLANTLPLPDEE